MNPWANYSHQFTRFVIYPKCYVCSSLKFPPLSYYLQFCRNLSFPEGQSRIKVHSNLYLFLVHSSLAQIKLFCYFMYIHCNFNEMRTTQLTVPCFCHNSQCLTHSENLINICWLFQQFYFIEKSLLYPLSPRSCTLWAISLCISSIIVFV